jgi:hypothetical protein
MDAKRFAMGTVVGGIVLFVLGYVLFLTLFVGFIEAHAGSATGLPKDPPVWWALILGHFFLAGLLTLALAWSGASSLADGLKTGALVGLLIWGGADLIFYAIYNISDLTGSFTDVVLEVVRFGITGLVITAVSGGSGAEVAGGATAPAGGGEFGV